MENCRHINKLRLGKDHSILNPQKWMCCQCGTTESVWACMSCSNVSCGRYNEEHALKHFQETKHPLAIEVNDKYVFCYECDDYILNDNAAGDLKILRSALSAIATQSFSDIEAKSRRILRSHSLPDVGTRWQEDLLRKEDLSQTAIKFRRHYLLAKTFAYWRLYVLGKKDYLEAQASLEPRPCSPQVLILPSKKAIIPGVAGLRNLGNTCYMNSILQVLSHLQPFRDYFLSLKPVQPETKPATAVSNHTLERQTTVECFQYLSEGGSKGRSKGGLNGGGTSHSPRARVRDSPQSKTIRPKSAVIRTLCEELHYLLRVLWSGKWALVSPHKMLTAVWQLIPFFKGYAQQDAQEFLSEMLDKVDDELKRRFNLNFTQSTIISDLFQGKLVSEVTCSSCGNTSQTYDPFYDLSLEFPEKYQSQNSDQAKCHIEEMLSKFTEPEELGKIYACEKCNDVIEKRKSRESDSKETCHTNATKRLQICSLPKILRLHLKRFMWSGRNHRGKISVHVEFPEKLDLGPYCHGTVDTRFSLYQLSAGVVHHGRGFGSGHYTAYCWNPEAGSWVHCNDSRVDMTTVREVMSSQVYILVYTKVRQEEPPVDDSSSDLDLSKEFEEEADEEITFNFRNSNIPKFTELKRRLSSSSGEGHSQLKRRKSTLW